MADNKKDKDEKFFYINHIKASPEKRLKIATSVINKSDILKDMYENAFEKDITIIPVIYTHCGNYDSLVFVVKYLNTYKDSEEMPAPEQPLLDNVEIDDIFEYEMHIFGDLLYFDNISDNINTVANILKVSKELGLQTLYKKMCAISAIYVQQIV
ncbi:MAG: hypothetical protein ACRCZI_04615 [Cetobacterium sp.]